MRIFKYFLLLSVLVLIGFIVFMSTQNYNYTISKSKIIKCSTSDAYKYVNNLKNWPDFISWNENKKNKFIQSSNKNASWKGLNTISVETLFSKSNDSIAQKININDVESEIYWNFKKVKTGTEIIITSTGKMNLKQKINAFFNGTTYTTLANAFEKSLLNLDKNLDYEVNFFSVKQDGVIKFPKTYFIGKTINSNPEKIDYNIKILLKEMVAFFDKNKIKTNGKPFVIYNSNVDKRTNISVCLPIKDSISISSNSDIFTSKIDETQAVKTTLTGDYSHIKSAQDSAMSYCVKNKYKLSKTTKPFYVYVNTILNTKKPSKWITEYIVPINKKTTPKKVFSMPKKNQIIENQEPQNL